MRRLITIGLIFCLAVIVAAIATFFYVLNFQPDRSLYPVRGIDVSHHQAAIDWPLVAAHDVSFAFIKATEGGDVVDARFKTNWDGARAAGIAVGAYHFFTFCRPGAEQAANLIATVPRAEPSLPVVVDLEFGGNCSTLPKPQGLATELGAFLGIVESWYGHQAVLYVTRDFLDTYGSILPGRRLWVRSIGWFPGTPNWLFWQYHSRGHVAGISGDVDLNVLQGNSATLTGLLATDRLPAKVD
jgi:lysozyme